MSPKLKQTIVEILKELNPKEIAVFGSYARGEETPDSDLDILISYTDPVDFFQIVGAIRQLEDSIDIQVDLVSKSAASQKFLNSIEADLIYLFNDVKRSA
ncbi:MAG: nucleotidyltransferase domain-containing protein [Nonlabens sp.]